MRKYEVIIIVINYKTQLITPCLLTELIFLHSSFFLSSTLPFFLLTLLFLLNFTLSSSYSFINTFSNISHSSSSSNHFPFFSSLILSHYPETNYSHHISFSLIIVFFSPSTHVQTGGTCRSGPRRSLVNSSLSSW